MKLRDKISQMRIPKNTPYCHNNRLKPCPYWKQLKYKDSTGHKVVYCKYLKLADIYQGDTLLWDLCKECGISDEF